MSESNRNVLSLDGVAARLRIFAAERDWEQFHSPKNIASALIVEAGELLEHFQWLTEDQSRELKDDPVTLARVSEELADVLIYAIRLSDLLSIDLSKAVSDKIDSNAVKYPVEKSRGSAKKYSDL